MITIKKPLRLSETIVKTVAKRGIPVSLLPLEIELVLPYLLKILPRSTIRELQGYVTAPYSKLRKIMLALESRKMIKRLPYKTQVTETGNCPSWLWVSELNK